MEKNASEYISGIVERITYHNHENGFAVLKVEVARQRDLVTITGEVPSITVGEEINAQGKWINNIKHGLTFKAQFIRSTPPNSIEGIEKYLGSGLIKGIGQFFAKKLVQTFGMEVFDVIEHSPDRLTEVEGIGKIRAEKIAKSFADQKVVREIMVFLQSNGISTARATRIYKVYGEEAIKIVSENPYRLAKDIRGIGFLSADKIARNLGISEHSPKRARAGINFTLLEALNDGHCGLPKDLLLKKAQELLAIPQDILSATLEEEISEQSVVSDNIGLETVIFLVSYYVYEKQSAAKLNVKRNRNLIQFFLNTQSKSDTVCIIFFTI